MSVAIPSLITFLPLTSGEPMRMYQTSAGQWTAASWFLLILARVILKGLGRETMDRTILYISSILADLDGSRAMDGGMWSGGISTILARRTRRRSLRASSVSEAVSAMKIEERGVARYSRGQLFILQATGSEIYAEECEI